MLIQEVRNFYCYEKGSQKIPPNPVSVTAHTICRFIFLLIPLIIAIQWLSVHMRTITSLTVIYWSKVHCSKSAGKDWWELITSLHIMPLATLKTRWRTPLYHKPPEEKTAAISKSCCYYSDSVSPNIISFPETQEKEVAL